MRRCQELQLASKTPSACNKLFLLKTKGNQPSQSLLPAVYQCYMLCSSQLAVCCNSLRMPAPFVPHGGCVATATHPSCKNVVQPNTLHSPTCCALQHNQCRGKRAQLPVVAKVSLNFLTVCTVCHHSILQFSYSCCYSYPAIVLPCITCIVLND